MPTARIESDNVTAVGVDVEETRLIDDVIDDVIDRVITRALGEELKKVREDVGISQAQLVARLPPELRFKALGSYEQGTRPLHRATSLRIARALGASPVLHTRQSTAPWGTRRPDSPAARRPPGAHWRHAPGPQVTTPVGSRPAVNSEPNQALYTITIPLRSVSVYVSCFCPVCLRERDGNVHTLGSDVHFRCISIGTMLAGAASTVRIDGRKGCRWELRGH